MERRAGIGTHTLRRTGAVAGTAAAAVGVVSTAGTLGTVSYLAHRLLTPEKHRPDNCRLLRVTDDVVVLDRTVDTLMPGRYGLWFDAGRGHLRMGDVLDTTRTTVTRELHGIDVGTPEPGGARWNGYYYWDRPDVCVGLSTLDVGIDSDIGSLPTWLVPADGSMASLGGSAAAPAGNRWAVLLHGRGALREECVRAIPPLHRLGITCLVPTYRNDPGAPRSPDGKHNLGLSEWRDVEAAVRYAIDHGAGEIDLVGWSMGGASVLQFLARSQESARVTRVVLDGPVVDWGSVIRHHGQVNRIPVVLSALTSDLIGQRWARRIVGVHEPLDVASTNWEHRADELRHRTLIIHSLDDVFVPPGPGLALAQRRPDIITFEPWAEAGHTKEWNVDPDRWERVVTEFLA